MKDVFKIESEQLVRLNQELFDREKIIQTLVEKNLNVVFDGLEFLSTEFQIEGLRPDSVAFDTEINSFVIIEYKNIKNKQVLDQGATYYRLLKERKENFVLLYNLRKNEQRETEYFNWDESYVIFLSPEFTKYQIGATGIGLPVRLYQIHKFDQGIITIERMGETATKHSRFGLSEDATTIKSYVKLDEYDEGKYLNGEYKRGNSSPETKELYFKIKKRLLDTFEGLEPRQRKGYMGFYFKSNDACICTLDVRKSKIRITYSISVRKKILSPSEFVKYNYRHCRSDKYFNEEILSSSEFVRDVENTSAFGVGHYQSDITNEDDIEKILPHVQLVYNAKIQN